MAMEDDLKTLIGLLSEKARKEGGGYTPRGSTQSGEQVVKDLNDFEPHRAARLIEDFVNEQLSNWYVRLSRRRFWNCGCRSCSNFAAN